MIVNETIIREQRCYDSSGNYRLLQTEPRKFYALLHEKGLTFVAFYYDNRRLILCRELEKYLEKHPEIRRRER